jgi:hypothetical protein
MKSRMIIGSIAAAFAMSASSLSLADEMPLLIDCDTDGESVEFSASRYPEAYDDHSKMDGGATLVMTRQEFNAHFVQDMVRHPAGGLPNPKNERVWFSGIETLLDSSNIGNDRISISLPEDNLQKLLDNQFGVDKCTVKPSPF